MQFFFFLDLFQTANGVLHGGIVVALLQIGRVIFLTQYLNEMQYSYINLTKIEAYVINL
jgi:hypothetical protein